MITEGFGRYKVKLMQYASIDLDRVQILDAPAIEFCLHGRDYKILMLSEEMYPKDLKPLYSLVERALKQESIKRHDKAINDLREAVEIVAKKRGVKRKTHQVCNFKTRVNR